MQHKEHIEGITELYHAITIAQPDADRLSRGELDHIIKSKGCGYRGEVLIVSSPKPQGERSGMIVGSALLCDVKKVEGGYLYRFQNMERMIEFPCQKRGAKGVVWDCFYTKGILASYPKLNLRKWIGLEK